MAFFRVSNVSLLSEAVAIGLAEMTGASRGVCWGATACPFMNGVEEGVSPGVALWGSAVIVLSKSEDVLLEGMSIALTAASSVG